jgi:hypothetical protein
VISVILPNNYIVNIEMKDCLKDGKGNAKEKPQEISSWGFSFDLLWEDHIISAGYQPVFSSYRFLN